MNIRVFLVFESIFVTICSSIDDLDLDMIIFANVVSVTSGRVF